jgi:hypothetical protein
MIDATPDVPDAGLQVFDKGVPARGASTANVDNACRSRRAPGLDYGLTGGSSEQSAMRGIDPLHERVAES